MSENLIFKRMQMLTGLSAFRRLQQANVAVFGVGGVGSWAAETLVRSGVESITLIDPAVVDVTNVNRQLQATVHNIGKPKVEELKQLLELRNPQVKVQAIRKNFAAATADEFDLGQFDYILDCIDSISCKSELIRQTHTQGITLFSSMGAACKLDPTRIQVASIWQTQGCSLAKALRRRLRRENFDGDFQAVFSTEVLPANEQTLVGNGYRKSVNGSAAHITATFGLFLAGLVIQDSQARA